MGSKHRTSDAPAPVDVTMKKEKKDKKDKKEKKEKRKSVSATEVEAEDGMDVSMVDVTEEKKEKKEKKKEKKDKEKKRVAESEDVEMMDVDGEDRKKVKKAKKEKESGTGDEPSRYLVPFAEPLATEDETTSVYEAVRRASRNRALLTGIKETQKCLRKAVEGKSTGSSTPSSGPRGVVVIAGDTYPWDIISHLPVLCEDAGVPFIYVRSRERLGRASGSNRIQTSAMMVLPTKGPARKNAAGSTKEDGAKKKDGDLSEAEYKKAFDKFAKSVIKAGDRSKF